MEQSRARIAAQGLGLATISYDSTAVLKAFAERQHIEYPLLSDPDSQVIRAYGIFNTTVDKDSFAYGIPYPGTYLLDASGVVVAKYFEDDYKVRDTAESILFRRFGLTPAPRGTVEAKHLKLTTSGGAEALRPNQRVTLAVDVELPPKVHVYAPGVSGYIPISLKLAESPAFKADPIVFPASKTLRLEAIQETVPVFEGNFRLLATVTLAGQQQLEPLLDAQREITVSGELRYQACDDRQCFVPESVPVKWTLRVLPFDRTRAPEAVRHK
ncbi:MAG: redoxin domain-containing protein [Acidobacteria bacterium]|nr:redoxin domain-containing protein [Acidobacteriota bacterium]